MFKWLTGLFKRVLSFFKKKKKSPRKYPKSSTKILTGYVYFFYSRKFSRVKIGCSKDPEKRYKGIKRHITDLQVLGFVKGSFELESYYLELFNEFRYPMPKKYKTKGIGYTEWFKVNKVLIEHLEQSVLKKTLNIR